MKNRRSALVIVIVAGALASCQPAAVVQTKTVAAPTGRQAADVPPAVGAANQAGAAKDDQTAVNFSQISASAGVIEHLGALQPPGAVTKSQVGEAQAIQQRAGPARPEHVQAALERELAAKAGDLAKVESQNRQLSIDAAAARQQADQLKRDYDEKIGDLNRQVAEAQAESKTLQAQFQTRINEVQQNADQRIADAEQRAREAEEKARKWWLNVLHLALLGMGILGFLVGAATLYLSKGSEWIRAALAAACGGIALVVDWSLGQWWMKWAVIGGVALVAIATAIYVITELRSHKTVEKLAARVNDADPKLSAARKIIAQVDTFYESAPQDLKERLDPIFAELRGQMDETERNAVHALRFEASTGSAISLPAK